MDHPEWNVIQDPESLVSLAPAWWRLWRRVPSALPFLSPAWLLPWWRHFSPGELFVLAAFRKGELTALAPGYIESGTLGRRILPLGISVSDHLDVLVEPGHSPEPLGALATAGASGDGSWDSWELENLLPDAAALRIPLPTGCSDSVHPQEICPVLVAPDGATDLRQAIPKKKRRNVILAANRCARRGALRIERAEGDSVLPFLEHLFRLHRARWSSRGESGVLASEPVRRFHRDAAPLLGAAGLLRLYTLALDGRVIAAQYGLTSGCRAYFYLTGFDPEFDSESPGVLLMAHAIGEALAEGCREIDFLRGREAYKYDWGAVDRPNFKRSIRRTG